MAWQLRSVVVIGLIYLFLIGVSCIEAGIKTMGADTQEQLFSNVSNPLAGLFVGILGTVLVQSSSASTSVIVGLVASGALGVDDAVPMIMGANIGTTVTNTLVSLGSVRRTNEFRRAFAAATVHDFFNLFAVSLLLPLELATGWLSDIASWISEQLVGSSGSDWKSPIKEWVKQPVSWLTDFWEWVGATGNAVGILLVTTGLVVVVGSLALITKNMRALVADRVERSLNAVLGRGGGIVAMAVGLLITVTVQSSSITTSIMVPLAGAGVVTLRNVYPVTLGANVGTTITALLAALAASSPDALTVALVHTVFNVSGILLLYTPRLVRDVPIMCAEMLAKVAADHRSWAVAYVVGMFVVLPIVGLAILN
ncbi:MAG: Na/Pi symporter [Acidimicrobiia bacterium]|nr:Na/Pi symporter [Acidimicrobiia bacterium]